MVRLYSIILICLFIAIPFADAQSLGSVVEKYEGIASPCTISNTHDDKGGTSYGLYQFNTNSRVIHDFVNQYGDTLDLRAKVGTKEFKQEFTTKCELNPLAFAKAQRAYATKKYFNPIRAYATKKGIPCFNAINEALFSMAIQHGRWKLLIDRTVKDVEYAQQTTDRNSWLLGLYLSRVYYVGSLNLAPRIKEALNNRYNLEIQDVSAIPEKFIRFWNEVLTGSCNI